MLGGKHAKHAKRSRVPVRLDALVGILAASLLLGAVFTLITAPSGSAALRPTLLGSPSIPTEFEITKPDAKPAEPDRAIDVPKDSYSPEPVVQIGRIRIPKLGVDQKLMHGVTLNNIDHGPSHWPGPPMPGEMGNVVVAGHRVTHTRPFRNVDQLQPGDLVELDANGVKATYSMYETFIVPPSGMHIVENTPEPILTTFGCHPPGSARYRIVTRWKLVKVEPLAGAAPQAAAA